MWRGANTGGSILCGLVWKQSHTFSKGKASTLILRLRVCFLVTGNFFSNFPPNWQQASGDVPPSSWGCLCLCVPRAEQLSWLRFHTWGFYPTKMPTWCQTTRVPWGHTLTHLPILAQELGTCHSHWVCPGHLWALCLIVPMLLAFPRFQTLLWQPLVLLSLHLTRETSCCILSLDPVWSSHLGTEFRSSQRWDSSLTLVWLFSAQDVSWGLSASWSDLPSCLICTTGSPRPTRCPLKTTVGHIWTVFATVSWMNLSLSDYLILHF